MSLLIEQLISIWKKYKLIILALIGLLVLIGLALFLFSAVGDWSFNRGQNKNKAAVNAAIEQIKGIESNINAEKQAANQLVEQIKVDTKSHEDAVNATDAQRTNTNAAIKRMDEARTANRNVSAEELEKLLEGLK